jgi:hypothetical protein
MSEISTTRSVFCAMDLSDEYDEQPEVHSFIIRIWIEEAASQRVALHGQITCVRDGELRYFSHLDQIPDLIRDRLRLDGEFQ